MISRTFTLNNIHLTTTTDTEADPFERLLAARPLPFWRHNQQKRLQLHLHERRPEVQRRPTPAPPHPPLVGVCEKTETTSPTVIIASTTTTEQLMNTPKSCRCCSNLSAHPQDTLTISGNAAAGWGCVRTANWNTLGDPKKTTPNTFSEAPPV